jgi:O-antigen/teichoic acid export membrane protein
MQERSNEHAVVTPGLALRTLRAGGWTMFSFGASQMLRLAGNLVLTRLLFPEAFGLMAIVQAVTVGTAMLSDIGIEQSIVQNRSGDTPTFLNSAWTLKVIRGASMWAVLCMGAYPLSTLYGEPLLAQLLPIAGLSVLISGFASTKLASADRHLTIARATIIEVGAYALGLLVMIILAWATKSVWSLVAGIIITAAAKTIGSHACLAGSNNKFCWDKRSRMEILKFGRWIFIGSTLTFLCGEGNRLVIANLIDVRTLAFFTLAVGMDQFPHLIIRQLGGRILFPAYSELVRHRPGTLREALKRARLVQLLGCWTISLAFVFFGKQLMNYLYDERYRDSGWMLQILALGSLAGCIALTYNGVLWAKGLVKTSTILLVAQLVIQIPAMAIGAHFGGSEGLLWGIAAVNWALYPFNAFVYARLGLWQPFIDVPLLAIALLITIMVIGPPGILGL